MIRDTEEIDPCLFIDFGNKLTTLGSANDKATVVIKRIANQGA